MWWTRLLTRGNYFLVLGTTVAGYEIPFGGGRPFVLAFAAALFGLKFTLPDAKAKDE